MHAIRTCLVVLGSGARMGGKGSAAGQAGVASARTSLSHIAARVAFLSWPLGGGRAFFLLL